MLTPTLVQKSLDLVESLAIKFGELYMSGAEKAAALIGQKIEELVPQIERLAERYERHVQKSLEANALREQQDTMLLSEFARRGWYVGGSITMRERDAIIKRIESGDDPGIESVLMEFARGCIDSVQEYATSHWPNRARTIADTLDAHRLGKYTLSIIPMLVEAEGISRELFNTSIFSTKGKQPATNPMIQQWQINFAVDITAENIHSPTIFSDRLSWMRMEHLLKVIKLLNAIAYSFRPDKEKENDWKKLRESDKTVSPLNRHALMHGETPGYLTEENSLRAIALLQFLTELHNAYIHLPERNEQKVE